MTPGTSGVSLVAIQQLQLEQSNTKPPDKRSLLEIQQEEQATRAEAEFLKWWKEEEERVRLQAEGPKPRPKQGRGNRKPKGKPGAQGTLPQRAEMKQPVTQR